MNTKYELVDSFNHCTMSRHRTLATAAKAEAKHHRWWKKNGNGSYIPTKIRRTDEKDLTESELDQLDGERNAFAI